MFFVHCFSFLELPPAVTAAVSAAISKTNAAVAVRSRRVGKVRDGGSVAPNDRGGVGNRG